MVEDHSIDEFKPGSDAQITDRGFPVATVSQRLALARVHCLLGRNGPPCRPLATPASILISGSNSATFPGQPISATSWNRLVQCASLPEYWASFSPDSNWF